ncbi:hypothetical protein COF81_13105 [Bacillus pseudomycoides]|uniref:Uncharacterized protein n=1 Tax=Bacillus pseudomycoides TaxID=64104 RepID=A0ABD6T831_9BACI|nr:hypothetical protein [Bacillus pseudomycoides]PEJ22409.1 hypothetical protein CN887_22980 [Bacillus pseudomycoides]PHE96383.1 hypothetical protein COF81_13105 [Bacillus pseudomycoides]
MEVIVNSTSTSTPFWNHFLLKDTEIIIRSMDGSTITENKMLKVGNNYRWDLSDNIVAIEIVVRAIFRHNGKSYPLLNIYQRFNVIKENNLATGLVATRWQKMSPEQSMGFTKAIPPLHPLLRLNRGIVTVAIEFVDITQLFKDIHGNTPWFSAAALLLNTNPTIRVLASLRGHPFIWYVVIPNSVASIRDLQPNLLYLPADFGGINYSSDRIEGITSPNHNTSVGSFQCGGESLFTFLTKPISDSDYDLKLKKYLELTERFKNRKGRNPPALHHLREVLSYTASDGKLEPNHWDIPFGWEQALYEKQQILLIPAINVGDGGIIIREHLKSLVESALMLIYTQSNTLTYETVSVNKLILTCYSQAGGNLFTAAYKNLSDIKALVCFEPQYMNKYLDGEDRNLRLGKDVIPLLLKQGSKVVIVGRRKQEKKDKYLPLGVKPDDLILLPDEDHYFILDYPSPSTPYDPGASPVLARRYSRLLKGNADPVITAMLTQESGDIDFASANEEAKVEEIIAKYRKAGFNDEKIIKAVFTPEYNSDVHRGGFFTHNFIISSGQELTADGKSILGFFHQALNKIT